jgi:RimJ/RimL family protein N-acetyltransferase
MTKTGAERSTGKKLPDAPLRPAKLSDAETVHHMFLDAVDNSPYYNVAFKTRERERFSPSILRALITADPNYVLLVITPEGKTAGFILSGPENGILIYYWGYLKPEFRRGMLASTSMRSFTKLWDFDKFHKICVYAKPDNRVSALLMQRLGYQHIALLKKHAFGEDVLLFEKELTKSDPDYAASVGVGISGRIAQKLKALRGG